MRTRRGQGIGLAALGLLGAAACGGGETVDVAGEYSLSLTNRENGCELENWTEGNTANNIPLTVTQSDSDVTAIVGGIPGGLLNLWLGSNTFHGTISGADIDMTLTGDKSMSEAGCTWTYNSSVAARLAGDVLRGDIFYQAATNGSPDCGTREGCETHQEFNGTRPPQ